MLAPLICLAVLVPTQTQGEIAFLAGTEQEDRCVHVLNVATTELRRVGAGKRDGAPVWSPDGQWLAFESVREEGGMGIVVVKADGSGLRMLDHQESWNRWPAWSPDGKRVAYSSGDGLDQRVRVTDLAAAQEVEWGDGKRPMLRPAWRSNDEIVAVGVLGEPGNQTADLFGVTAQGATPLVETRGGGEYFEWHPTPGTRENVLAYESNDGGDREIFVYLPRFGVVDVSNHREADWNPVWSSDGHWLVFESFRGGMRGIYRVNPRRILVSPVAADPQWDNWSPSVSPDNEWIAFISNRTGRPALHLTSASGGAARVLTTHTLEDLAPAWRPEKR